MWVLGVPTIRPLEWVRGRYVLLLNTDAFVPPDALTQSIAYLKGHPRCGLLGGKLVGRDGALQPSARYFPTPLNIFLQKTGLNQIFRQGASDRRPVVGPCFRSRLRLGAGLLLRDSPGSHRPGGAF